MSSLNLISLVAALQDKLQDFHGFVDFYTKESGDYACIQHDSRNHSFRIFLNQGSDGFLDVECTFSKGATWESCYLLFKATDDVWASVDLILQQAGF